MTTHTDGDQDFAGENGHDHDHERAIPTLLKVGVLVAVALASIWIGWLLR